MKKYIWLVVILIVAVVLGVILDLVFKEEDELQVITDITITELNELSQNDYQFVDIRTKDEYLGITGAIHLPQFNINLDYYQFEKDHTILNGLDKNKPVVIICRTGNRSGSAAILLKNLGFTKVYNVEPGIVACGEGNNLCEI